MLKKETKAKHKGSNMANKICTYDSTHAREISFESLVKLMTDMGGDKIFIKKLSPNDNSKNQPYFGSHLTDVSFIPSGTVKASESKSKKNTTKDVSIKYQASINLKWVDSYQNIYPAPHAKLIYYPQYPEVRFSGFLLGSQVNLARWMDPNKDGRAQGRWLILAIANNETVYGYIASPESNLAREFEEKISLKTNAVFSEIDLQNFSEIRDTKTAILKKFSEIHDAGWINGQKLGKDFIAKPYKAKNGGGYTLESILGISPNSSSKPDYLGWEVKSFNVKEFPLKSPSRPTLMTPEPDGGIYSDDTIHFIKRFGYPDKEVADRINFSSPNHFGKFSKKTDLTLSLDGFDTQTNKITNAFGAILLQDKNNTIAASWSFEKMLDHWKKKHSQAVYVPNIRRDSKSGGYQYHYSKNIMLGEGTDFSLFLSAIVSDQIFHDPGIKLTNATSDHAEKKVRNQFRANPKNLNFLYHKFDYINLKEINKCQT